METTVKEYYRAMKDNNPAKQEIYNLLHEHKRLREEVSKTPRFEKVWENYNSQYNPNIDSIIELSVFEEIEKEYDIQFSNETKYFYSTIGGSVRIYNERIIRDDFCSKIYYYIQDNDGFAKSYLEYTFSKIFVIKIIHKLHELNEEEINELTSKIREKAGINYKLDSKEELLAYILETGGEYYDGKFNIFKNDFIQKCYQELNLDKSMIYPLLILWGHCGGVCYLILHKDYKDLMCFESGNPLYIESNGSKQYYRRFESHFDLNNETHFLLQSYKSTILESIQILQDILEGKEIRNLTSSLGKQSQSSSRMGETVLDNSEHQINNEPSNTKNNADEIDTNISFEDVIKYVFYLIFFLFTLSKMFKGN